MILQVNAAGTRLGDDGFRKGEGRRKIGQRPQQDTQLGWRRACDAWRVGRQRRPLNEILGEVKEGHVDEVAGERRGRLGWMKSQSLG